MLSAGVGQTNIASTAELNEDPYPLAGRLDPDSLAICEIHTDRGQGTGFLTLIEGHRVVLTAAHVGNPSKVSFPTIVRQDGKYIQAPYVRAFLGNSDVLKNNALNFEVKKSITSDKYDVQVLFLDEGTDLQILFSDATIERLPYLDLATAKPSSDERLKTIGCGTYCSAASGRYPRRMIESTSISGAIVPVKLYFPTGRTSNYKKGTMYISSTKYADTKTLETHPYGGFSGAPVMGADSKVVSMVTDSTKELHSLENKLYTNLVFSGVTIAAWWAGYRPKNVFIKVIFPVLVVQSLRMVKRALDLMHTGGECIHLNLQHPEIKSWLHQVVKSNYNNID